ncbi:MAG TPA: methyltransferase domain-containing protein [Gemmataceae bacterium]|nr:methyltransferase domain-containing protein [Gemmataceae bacterium]
MSYQTSEARAEFDRWSRRYDRSLLQKLLFKPSHRMILEALAPDSRQILDVGCGTGRFAARLLKHFAEARVWGVDLSPGMLARCQDRCISLDGRLQIVQGDSEKLPFADDTFDAVTCAHSFHHYPHQERALQEMYRVLRPGGRLLIVDGDRDGLWGRLVFDVVVVLMEGAVRHLTSQGFCELYRATGFTDVRQRRRGGLLPFLLTLGHAAK